MKPRTLEQYEQRFRQSVDMYLKWLDNDPTWKPAQRKRVSNGSGSKAGKEATRVTSAPVEKAPTVEQHQPGMIKYPFPIRPGLQGTVTLPEDLTIREASASPRSSPRWRLKTSRSPCGHPPGQWNQSDPDE